MSEPVFLPLLLWSVILLVDIPQQQRVPPVRMGAIIVLLAMLTLTRYVGVFIYGAIGMWWVWHRWQQQRLRQLWWEVPLLGVAFVPFVAFLVRNWLVSVEPLGKHTEQSLDTFWDGMRAVVSQTSQLILPALRPLPNNPFLRSMELQTQGEAELQQALWILIGLQMALVGILFLLGRWLWIAHRRRGEPLALPATPILSIVAIFIGLYVIAQPFLSFAPIDYRDSTTLLCLLQPLLVVIVIRVLQQNAMRVLVIYSSINVLLIVIPVVVFGTPRVISLNPPMVHDFADYTEADTYKDSSIVDWLLVDPLRTTFVARHRPHVAALLQQVDTEHTVFITNLRYLLLSDDEYKMLPGRVLQWGIIPEETAWLTTGSCQSRHPVYIILTRFSDASNLDDIIPRIERKCPHLTRTDLSDDTVVYQLERK